MNTPTNMTPGDELHLTLLMAPQSLNFVTGQDRQHLLAYGRAAFDAGKSAAEEVHLRELAAYRTTVENLKAELVQEAARTAEEKLRADQMSQQHDTQSALNREAREQLAAIKAAAGQQPFGYVNTNTGQYFKDVDQCRKGNEGHWRTVYAAPQAAPAAQAVEPEFFTVFASHNGGKIALPGYSNETEKGVKDLVLQDARQEGYKGTVSGRLLELGWWIGPVFTSPSEAAAPAPAAVAVPAKVVEALEMLENGALNVAENAKNRGDGYDEGYANAMTKMARETLDALAATPPTQEQDVQRDAERYRGLRLMMSFEKSGKTGKTVMALSLDANATHNIHKDWMASNFDASVDRTVDAAIAASAAQREA